MKTPLAPGEIKICFRIQRAHAPAFRAAVEAFSESVAKRAENVAKWDTEEATTAALVAVGILRAAVNARIPEGDKDYV